MRAAPLTRPTVSVIRGENIAISSKSFIRVLLSGIVARAIIVVDVTHPEEVTACEQWFAKWVSALTYRSDNQGCRCCVNIWEVEGPDEALAALPSGIKANNVSLDCPSSRNPAR
jgi:hypothetical protein